MNPVDALKRLRARKVAKGEDVTELDAQIAAMGEDPRVERAVVNPAQINRRVR